MTNSPPDGAIFLVALAAVALCLLLYVITQAIRGKGIAVLPDWLVPGEWWDICLHKNLVLRSTKHNYAHYPVFTITD